MIALREQAPGKVNLCLFLGPTRPDRRHELVTVFQPLTLADDVSLTPAPLGAGADEVLCPGVEGENLAAVALRAFRARTGWAGAPVRLTIDKRIPVAAGMAGGSADAGAALRLAARAAGIDDDALLLDIAEGLGADVPAQVRPGRALATGAGETLAPLGAPPAYGVAILPSHERLSTADVFREADRLGLARDAEGLAERLAAVRATAGDLPGELLLNDLQPAATSLCPAIADALEVVRAAGARHALVCGSGPTVAGLFDDPTGARVAVAMLSDRDPRPVAVTPWEARS
ncbi:MAG: 4-(cytidine 5'-diphospho)-2-C-methyl-D-erythritol kinase [Solirubrobacteraceae bacterium]